MFLIDLGPYFGRDDVTDDVIIESSEDLGKFRKCISVTLPKGFGQIFYCFALRTKYVHLMTKPPPPLYRENTFQTIGCSHFVLVYGSFEFK